MNLIKLDLSTALKKSSSAASKTANVFSGALRGSTLPIHFFALLITQFFSFPEGHSKTSSRSGELWRDVTSYITSRQAFFLILQRKQWGARFEEKKLKHRWVQLPSLLQEPTFRVEAVQMDPLHSDVNVSSCIQRPKYHFSFSLCLRLFCLFL